MFFKKKDQRNIDEILTPKDNKKQENDFVVYLWCYDICAYNIHTKEDRCCV